MHYLLKIRTFVTLLISWILFPLSFLFPRSKKIWVFIGWQKNKDREIFADNSKYLFLHTSQHYPEIESIWIGQDQMMCNNLKKNGYKAYSIHSLAGVYYSLRAGYTIIDAVMRLPNWRYSGRSKTIQLWHADGIKKLAFTSKWTYSSFIKMILHPGSFKHFYFLIASSEYIRDNFVCPSFDVKKTKVRTTGLPRYDIFFNSVKDANIDVHTELSETLDHINQEKSEKIILYAPTFRRGKDLVEQLSPLNFKELNYFLNKKNYHLVVSLHPKFSTSNWIPEEQYSNIFFSNSGFDKYPLLSRFDLLISDYSSICIEFLLLNKPTIFYTYDIAEYRKNEGLAEKFWNHMPGSRVSTYQELVIALEADTKILMAGTSIVREEIFQYRDGNSSERVTQEIRKDMDS